jgi:pimeloyl-ACP methyl ester carboxylesterase
VLFTKMGVLLAHDYDWSKDVAEIKAPTMLVFGDADAVRTEHAVEFFRLLGGGHRDGGWDGSGMSNARLAILPGLTQTPSSRRPRWRQLSSRSSTAPRVGSGSRDQGIRVTQPLRQSGGSNGAAK